MTHAAKTRQETSITDRINRIVRPFDELQRLETLIKRFDPKLVKSRVLGEVEMENEKFPIWGFVWGSEDKTLPTLGLFGGIHGLEVIGTHVLFAYFESLTQQCKWDESLAEVFKKCRIVSIPMVNPGGVFLRSRCNPRGVDLMRNAPIDAPQATWFVGGQRISRRLPYYRGALGEPMEVESQALVNFVKEEMFEAQASIAVDFHSGFGNRDRLWFPYAKTRDAFPQDKEIKRFTEILNLTYPNHIYKIEAQSLIYTTHGDLWDYLFDLHQEKWKNSRQVPFLPWTLEMGSWMWIRKNPFQIFSSFGLFNPNKPHRYRRTMRRHLPLIDLFFRGVRNFKAWSG